MDLLFRLKQKRLAAGHQRPARQPRAHQRRIADRRARARAAATTCPQGIAIGSGIYLDEHTHIEATRYPAGSDAMGLLATLLTGGRPGLSGASCSWLGHAGAARCCATRCTRPLPASVRMGARIADPALHADAGRPHRYAPGRPWFWPFQKTLMSHGQQIPTFIPQANEFARDGGQADRRHAHEHGHRDPVQRARHGAHPGRLPHGRQPRRAWWMRKTASSAIATCMCAMAP